MAFITWINTTNINKPMIDIPYDLPKPYLAQLPTHLMHWPIH